MRKAKWNCGITLLLAAAALLPLTLVPAGCLNPAALSPRAEKAAEAAVFDAGQHDPYTATVYLGGDAASAEASASTEAGRSVAGPTKERIQGINIRNFVQIIAVDKASGKVAGFYEVRRTSVNQALANLMINGLVRNHTYGILLLQGHWERDYAREKDGNYAYTNSLPTLLSAGYKEVTFSGGGAVTIAVWPIYVDTAFTAGDGALTAEPAVNAGKPGAAILTPAAWTARWKVLRGASGTASGFGDLVTAQQAAGFSGNSLIARNLKAVVQADGYGGTAPSLSPSLTGHTVTLPLNADYTALSRIGKGGSVNFELSFVPFNVTEGWAEYDNASVFDLRRGPPEWIVRNGINSLPQDGKTDFASFGNAPAATANGNGAVRFTVAAPRPAAAGELAASNGSWTAGFVTFTASGYTGTAAAWYAPVPVNAGGAPAYTAYTLLGNIPAGTRTMPVTFPKTVWDGYDAYIILLKDGKAGEPYRIIIAGDTAGLPDSDAPSSLKAARGYNGTEGDYIDVKWTAAANPASSYEVYLSTDAVRPSSSVLKIPNPADGNTQYNCHILRGSHDPKQNYYVWVTAVPRAGGAEAGAGPVKSPSRLEHDAAGYTAFTNVMANSAVSNLVFSLTAGMNVGALTLSRAVTLQSKGAPVTITGSLTVQSGAAVKLANITVNGGGRDTVTVQSGNLVIEEGAVITGGGSGVVVNGGAFNMTGGVVGVYPKGSGGNTGSGVVVSSGTAEMSGGRIWVNGSNGVEMTGGTFNMTGGEIGANGGNGVEMTGGTFTKRGGGTVYGKHETAEQKNSLGSINGKANTYGPNDNYPAGQ